MSLTKNTAEFQAPHFQKIKPYRNAPITPFWLEVHPRLRGFHAWLRKSLVTPEHDMKKGLEVHSRDISMGARRAVEALLDTNARQATVYHGPKLVVKATRRHKPDRRAKSIEVVLTMGVPNHEGRKFVKDCQQAGEPFPVRNVQLKFWPKKKSK